MKYLSFITAALCLISTAVWAEIDSVSVFGSGTKHMNQNYKKQAYQFGQTLAQRKKALYYGGSGIGLSGAVFQGVFDQKGEVTSVSTPVLFQKECPASYDCQKSNPILVNNIYEQKKLLFESGDALIFMPGSFETLDAFATFNTLVQQEEEPQKPIIFLNINHFWDRLREQLFEMRKQEVVGKDVFDYIVFVDKVKDVLPAAEKAQRLIEQKKAREARRKELLQK